MQNITIQLSLFEDKPEPVLPDHLQKHIGKKHGNLTVKKYVGRDNWNKPLYLAECECGIEKVYPISAMAYGNTKSCGCQKVEFYKNRAGKHKIIDLAGQVFGDLTAKWPMPRIGADNQCLSWHCECACGGSRAVPSPNLRNGMTTHCGCKNPSANPRPERKPKRKPIDREQFAFDVYCWIKDGVTIRDFAEEQGYMHEGPISTMLSRYVIGYKEKSIERRNESKWKNSERSYKRWSSIYESELDMNDAVCEIFADFGIPYKSCDRESTPYEIDIKADKIYELKIRTSKKNLYTAFGQLVLNHQRTSMQPVLIIPEDCGLSKEMVKDFLRNGIEIETPTDIRRRLERDATISNS